ncbi:hypothetical protein [Vallicoccus soli]|uniref:hypothetical protein n=1 Tax=Vallicoccus soli TaxID=2339232 RepID=UPI001403CA20|nr:hypothetical protein [Vallicoccus soli]
MKRIAAVVAAAVLAPLAVLATAPVVTSSSDGATVTVEAGTRWGSADRGTRWG